MPQRVRAFPGLDQFKELASSSAAVLYQVLRVGEQQC